MKVSLSNITYSKYPVKSVAFGDNACKTDRSQPDLVTHYTSMGRDKYLDRTKLSNYVIDLINSGEKVEFIFCGCSDGSEVFDFAMALKKQFDKKGINMSKFPHIKAFDTNPELIRVSKSGRINLSEESFRYIIDNYGPYYIMDEGPVIKIKDDNLEVFKEKSGSAINHSYQIDKKLLENIDFYTGNLLEESDKLKPDTCKIVFCRNVARYNSEKIQRQIAQNFSKNLKNKSLVIVGFQDENNKKGSPVEPLQADKVRIDNPSKVPMVYEMNKTSFIHAYDINNNEGTVYRQLILPNKKTFIKRIFKNIK